MKASGSFGEDSGHAEVGVLWIDPPAGKVESKPALTP